MTPRPKHQVPADMLLLQERRRRIQSGSIGAAPEHRDAAADAEDIFSGDEDQLIEEAASAPPATPSRGDVVLRRPISSVSLAAVSWSGPIDHEVLQAALACHPLAAGDARSYPQLFEAALSDDESGSALEVTLHPQELGVLAQAATQATRGSTQMLLAARFPDRLVGAEAATCAAVSPVLAAYRHAALSCAWHERLGTAHDVQSHRERDEAAVAVLSTLRALLGER